MIVRNLRSGVVLGDRVIAANTSELRRTGLLRHKTLPEGEGLWIAPCEAVHTIGMNFPIDVLFLNKKKKVVKIRPEMGKWRFSACLKAHSVLELPAGMAQRTGTQVGDDLELVKD